MSTLTAEVESISTLIVFINIELKIVYSTENNFRKRVNKNFFFLIFNDNIIINLYRTRSSSKPRYVSFNKFVIGINLKLKQNKVNVFSSQ